MKARSVAVLGGGPGGLYAARLLKLAHPSWRVTVHEQSAPEDTFGFGVGLAARTQRNLADADPDTFDEIMATAHRHEMEMRVGSSAARIRGGQLVAVARSDLLTILVRHAEKAGVVIDVGERRSADDLDADLVVAADGAGSTTREAWADEFGATVDVGRSLYLWCGADFALDTALFAPAATEHGTFVTHAYPYADDRSTFLIETDESTWRSAGFHTSTPDAADGSDEVALDHLSEVFGDVLRGHRLIGNRSRWLRFRTVRCRRWSRGTAVLLGDAAHTAHYSIGSGTKMAMEDAIALRDATVTADVLVEALLAYEARRRPDVVRLQDLAQRSQLWWESFPERMGLPVEQLMISYMTRAGNVPLDRFMSQHPEVAKPGLGAYAGVEADLVPSAEVARWVLEQPLGLGDVRFPTRWIDDAGAFTDLAVNVAYADESAVRTFTQAALQTAGANKRVRLCGGPSRPDVLTRLDIAERIRLATDLIVAVDVPAALTDDAAAALASSRIDGFSTSEGVFA